MGSNWEPGDWRCNVCKRHVFKRKNVCGWRGCDGRKRNALPHSKDEIPERRAGDWDCPKCGDLVFASRSKCRRCGVLKPGTTFERAVGAELVTASARRLGTSESIADAAFNTAADLWAWSGLQLPAPDKDPKAEASAKAPPVSECVVCMDQACTHLFVGCGHQAVCANCADQCNNVCPVCRTRGRPQKVYIA